jgi:hypothetical protein
VRRSNVRRSNRSAADRTIPLPGVDRREHDNRATPIVAAPVQSVARVVLQTGQYGTVQGGEATHLCRGKPPAGLALALCGVHAMVAVKANPGKVCAACWIEASRLNLEISK